jgi:hypothetical protein
MRNMCLGRFEIDVKMMEIRLGMGGMIEGDFCDCLLGKLLLIVDGLLRLVSSIVADRV